MRPDGGSRLAGHPDAVDQHRRRVLVDAAPRAAGDRLLDEGVLHRGLQGELRRLGALAHHHDPLQPRG